MNKLKPTIAFLLSSILFLSCSSIFISCNKEMSSKEFLQKHSDIEITIDTYVVLDKEKDYNFLYDCTKGYSLTVTDLKTNIHKTVFVTSCDWESMKEDFGIDYELSFIKYALFDKLQIYRLKFRRL